MSAKPARKTSYYTMFQYMQDCKNYSRALLAFCRTYPTVVITVLYLMLSLSGIIQLVVLFEFLDFDILPYLDLTDYVIAGITFYQPLFVMVAGTALGMLLYAIHVRLLVFSCYRRWNRVRVNRNSWQAKLYFPSPSFSMPIILLAFLVSYASSQGSRTASYLTSGHPPLMKVQLIYPMPFAQGPLTITDAALIARTYHYLFLLKDNKLLAIPNGNVAALSPQQIEKTLPAVETVPPPEAEATTTPAESDKKPEQNKPL